MATPDAPPVQITHVDSTRGELMHSFGDWLPDGQHFVFLVLGQTPGVRGIYFGSVNLMAPRRLLLDYSRPAYVPEGDGRGLLLFVRGSTLVAQRFDERTLVLTGQVFPLGDRVRLAIVNRGATGLGRPFGAGAERSRAGHRLPIGPVAVTRRTNADVRAVQRRHEQHRAVDHRSAAVDFRAVPEAGPLG
jgi:hypothetical protein